MGSFGSRQLINGLALIPQPNRHGEMLVPSCVTLVRVPENGLECSCLRVKTESSRQAADMFALRDFIMVRGCPENGSERFCDRRHQLGVSGDERRLAVSSVNGYRLVQN